MPADSRGGIALIDLQGLWETGQALGAALRCEVQMPLPVKLMTSPIDGVSRAMPVRSVDAIPLVGEEAARLGAMLDQVDAAISLCGAIRQAADQDQRHRRLSVERRTSAEMPSTYVVTKPIDWWGGTFAPGVLVDQSVVPVAALYRMQLGSCIQAA